MPRQVSFPDFNAKIAFKAIISVRGLKHLIFNSDKLNTLLLFAVVVLVTALWGCSKTEYIMPDTAAGRECAQQAEQEKTDCYRAANAKWNACMEKEREKAEKRHEDAMRRYYDEVDRCERDYRRELREYKKRAEEWERCAESNPKNIVSKCGRGVYKPDNECYRIREPQVIDFTDKKWCDQRRDDDRWTCRNDFKKKFVDECHGRIEE
jgi:hypothetical protein